MPALSFGTYFLYAYVVLPLVYRSIGTLYSHRFDFWPLIVCSRPLIRCIQEPECKRLLQELQECQDGSSEARRNSAATFAHVQHPQDPCYCRYECFDRISTAAALDFLECVGGSGFLEPAAFSDECASMEGITVLPFNTIESVLGGQWVKLYTTGWDQWPCQWTEFHPPHSTEPSPESWMTAWPKTPSVWRMDLYWTNERRKDVTADKDAAITFHMNNEMYPHQSWNYTLSLAEATLKTRAVMWGTEAHENWYLLDYDATSQTMLVYYCAYTEAISRFDSMAMVLQKRNAEHQWTEEKAKAIEQTALHILGKKHGSLQRIEACH